MQVTILIIAIGAFLLVVYHDVRSRQIPNGLVLATVLLGFTRIVFCEDLVGMILSLAAATAVLAAAVILYRWSVLGGGDVKLVSAAALLVGHHEVCHFLIVMSLWGAGLALLILAQAKLGLTVRWIWRRGTPLPLTKTAVELGARRRPNVPYGVAIAAAGATLLIIQTLIPR